MVANETLGGGALRDQVRRAQRGLPHRGARRHARPEHAAEDAHLGRGPGARAGAGAAGREPRAARARRASTPAARSATATRFRRSRTRYARSARTRSSSRPTPKAARTGSSEASSRARASASRFPSPTWSSTSRPNRRRPLTRRYLPATDETYLATAVICARRELALEGRHDAAAVRDLALHGREARHQVVEVRPDVAARARVLERVAAPAVRGEDVLAARRGLPPWPGTPATARRRPRPRRRPRL